MSRSVKIALFEASRDAFRVAWGGIIAFALYLGLVSFGPAIDGRLFPVIRNYSLTSVETLPGGGFSFVPHFEKARDCTYYGVTWFAQDETGNLTRIQLSKEHDPGPPITGPTGDRVGDRVTLYPPPGTRSVFGLNHHDCEIPWQTRTMVGPFVLRNGVPDANASSLRAALRRR